MAICSWLIVGVAGDRIMVYASLYEESGETLWSLLAEDPELFGDIAKHLRGLVDHEGRQILADGQRLSWRLGTRAEAIAVGARDDDERVEHILTIAVTWMRNLRPTRRLENCIWGTARHYPLRV
jgi:hypothetical protein